VVTAYVVKGTKDAVLASNNDIRLARERAADKRSRCAQLIVSRGHEPVVRESGSKLELEDVRLGVPG
jgi:hypothetical protein